MKTAQQPDPLSPQVVRYGWDNDRIFAEYDDKGDAIQETVYFGSTPVALLKDGKTYRIFSDQIDTPRVITDSTNNILCAWDIKPFGESQPDEDVDGDNIKLSYNLRFPGQYYDVETGKHYNFNRDYDPVTGRYVQSDPIGLDGGMNGYGYISNKPLTDIDPTGLAAKVTKIGNDLTVQMRINYTGKYASQGPVFNAGIKSIWEGTYGSWTLTIDLSSGPVNTINVIFVQYDPCPLNGLRDLKYVSRVNGVGGSTGTWNLRDADTKQKCSNTRQELAAHEAGHLMGLDDKYTEGAKVPWHGWEDNIMGVTGMPVQQRNLGEIVRFHHLK